MEDLPETSDARNFQTTADSFDQGTVASIQGDKVLLVITDTG